MSGKEASAVAANDGIDFCTLGMFILGMEQR